MTIFLSRALLSFKELFFSIYFQVQQRNIRSEDNLYYFYQDTRRLSPRRSTLPSPHRPSRWPGQANDGLRRSRSACCPSLEKVLRIAEVARAQIKHSPTLISITARSSSTVVVRPSSAAATTTVAAHLGSAPRRFVRTCSLRCCRSPTLSAGSR